MIQLTRIAPENPIKSLRSQINHMMDEVEGDQPQLGMPSSVSIQYYETATDDPSHTRVATSAPETVKGNLLLQCLPDNDVTMITDVNGCLHVTADPVLEPSVTELSFSVIQIIITSVRLSNRTVTRFKMPSDYGYPRPDDVFAYVGKGITAMPLYPLGFKSMFIGFGTKTPRILDGQAYMWGDQEGVRILIEAQYPLPE